MGDDIVLARVQVMEMPGEFPLTKVGARRDGEYYVRSRPKMSEVLFCAEGCKPRGDAQFFGQDHSLKALRWVEREVEFHGT